MGEVKGNLLAEQRKATLDRFATNGFRRVAQVVMGEPPAEYKAKVQDKILADKKATAEAEWKKKKAEKERKKQLEEQRRKIDEERKKRVEAAKKAKEAKEAAEKAAKEAAEKAK